MEGGERNILLAFNNHRLSQHASSYWAAHTPGLSRCVMSLDARSTNHMCHKDRSSHGTAACAQCDKVVTFLHHRPVRSDIDS